MLEKKQIYEICLENYYYPRYASVTKSYYGTREDIDHLMAHLAQNPWTAMRYQETIAAVENYDLDNQTTHRIVGQEFPILTPVQEICRFETTLSDHKWNYKSYNGSVVACCAKQIHVCQILIQDGDGFERCLSASTEHLGICLHSPGWCYVNGILRGFPGIVTWDGDHTHKMHLFASQEHYTPDQLAQARADLTDPDRIDLSVLMADIFGEV